MTNNTYATITTYNFPSTPHSEIRVTKKQDGTVWFAVEDISHATGIAPAYVLDGIGPNHLASFVTYVHKDNKGTVEIDMISFARLQLVIATTRTSRARKFLAWIENEIMGIEVGQEDLIELTNTITPGYQPVDVQAFNFHNSKNHEIRTIIKEDGSIWFVAKDVCGVLEIQNTTQAIEFLDNDERSMYYIGRQGKVNTISESGLYALIFKSRKPEAKKFRKWVTSVVLPQIRQTGSYMPTQPAEPKKIQAPAQAMNPKTITAFLQATTDTFWAVEKAINEYRAMEQSLKKARKDASIIIRSIRDAFPDSKESIELLGGLDSPGLEVEMR